MYARVINESGATVNALLAALVNCYNGVGPGVARQGSHLGTFTMLSASVAQYTDDDFTLQLSIEAGHLYLREYQAGVPIQGTQASISLSTSTVAHIAIVTGPGHFALFGGNSAGTLANLVALRLPHDPFYSPPQSRLAIFGGFTELPTMQIPGTGSNVPKLATGTVTLSPVAGITSIATFDPETGLTLVPSKPHLLVTTHGATMLLDWLRVVGSSSAIGEIMDMGGQPFVSLSLNGQFMRVE